jgi:lipopolysaccharide transport system permease protein
MLPSELHHHQLILEAGRADRQYWRDLWTFRELLIQLARRDIAVHYKQTIIGGLWAVVRPLVTVVILTVVFSRVAKLEADGGVWYPIYVLAAMIAWQLFAAVLGESSNSLVNRYTSRGCCSPSVPWVFRSLILPSCCRSWQF